MSDKQKDLKAKLTQAKKFVDQILDDKNDKIDALQKELIGKLIDGERKCYNALIKELSPPKEPKEKKKKKDNGDADDSD
jgi:hypothetical protein